jgi:hypothetical protein
VATTFLELSPEARKKSTGLDDRSAARPCYRAIPLEESAAFNA